MKDIDYYLSLPYEYEITYVANPKDSPTPYYYGICKQLTGLMADAPTVEELVKLLDELRRDFIEVMIENGEPIPEPDGLPSGALRLRMPRTLHWKLAREAEREGVSLNQLLVSKLSK